MGFGYLILLLAVTIIAYYLFAREMSTRAKIRARRYGRRRNGENPDYRVGNRCYIIGALIIWLILASVAILTGGLAWIIIATIVTIVCAGYILVWSYHGTDRALIRALTRLIIPFGAFVFCVIANSIKFPGGLIAGFAIALMIAALPYIVYLQGFYDSRQNFD